LGSEKLREPFRERLKGPIIVCDGAMGTLLYSRGVSYQHPFDELNLSNPQIVRQVHLDYIAAGAEIIETNTFGANRYRLSEHGLEDRVREINLAGAKAAREARDIAGKQIFVAGSMGPFGQPMEPLGSISVQETFDAFREQAEGLLEGGVDLFIVETQRNLEKTKQAVLAVKSICDSPVVAMMTFTEEGRTLRGSTPEQVARELTELGVDAVGANCSMGPQMMLDIIAEMREHTNLPLAAMPNAGLPRFVDGRYIYITTPDYMASQTGEFANLGVRLIGGCCGTTPEHIKAMAQAAADLEPELREIAGGAAIIVEAPGEPEVKAAPEQVSDFGRKLGKQFAVSVEVDPPKGTNPEKLLRAANMMKQAGVDAVNIADSPMARVRMSCLAVASLLQREVRIETILHFTCRDRNLMGLQSDLMGAHALGVRNILAITGDPPRVGDYPSATAVYDVDSIGLVKIISTLNAGKDLAGNSIGRPTSFLVGVAVNPVADDIDLEVQRLRRKVQAGAKFAFSQPLFETGPMTAFLQRVSDLDIPVFLGLLPLASHRHAEFLHHEVPGITIPDPTRDRMRLAGEKSAEEGVRICRELLAQARELFSGVYLIPSFGRYELALSVLER
jgi:methionine synthase I (cobalamin-dependent)/5,10-methylenetetrahydrofolate reductase